MQRKNIFSYSEKELCEELRQLGQPAFRAKQICQWMYSKGVVDVAQMSNVPQGLRKDLEKHFCLRWLAERREPL